MELKKLIALWYNPSKLKMRKVGSLLSRVISKHKISSARKISYRIDLSQEEMNEGCMLGLDTWADTCCMGKHAHVREIIEGKTVSASGFAATLPTVNDIPIANCSLAYDALDGTTYILEVNNALYLGDTMDHCLLCPNQCEDNGIRIDLRPAYYYPNDSNASTLYSKEANLNIPIQHKGPLPFFNVRRPTQDELASCDVVQLTSIHEWDPYDIGYHLSPCSSATLQSI